MFHPHPRPQPAGTIFILLEDQIFFFPPSHLKKSTLSNPPSHSFAIFLIIGPIDHLKAQPGSPGNTLENIKCPA